MMSRKGIALLMVLWVLTILMVIALSFSYMTRTETFATLSFKGSIEKKFLAEAGIERGVMELFYRERYRDQTIEMEDLGVWKADGRLYQGEVGDGSYRVRIIDESGKVDINTASEVVLKNMFINAGVGADDADIIVDSIMDWKDEDDLHRLHGAESDYYLSLPNPYKAKNADFDTLEELLLVKGMTPEILYGSRGKKGVIEFLTVHSGALHININAAPREVLAALPGMSPELADSIISYRDTREIADVEELQNIIGDVVNAIEPYISTEDTDTFTIDAFGSKGNERGSYAIRATVVISDFEETHKYLYYKSPSNIYR
jgi:general secretion pathway protein K